MAIAGGIPALDLWLVHAIEELPRVRGECLDVAALAFGIKGVEDERGLPGPRDPRDDDQLVERDVEVEVLQVVLSRATHADGVTGAVSHSVTVKHWLERRVAQAADARSGIVNDPWRAAREARGADYLIWGRGGLPANRSVQSSTGRAGLLYKVSLPGRTKHRCRTPTTRGGFSARRYNRRRPNVHTKENAE